MFKMKISFLVLVVITTAIPVQARFIDDSVTKVESNKVTIESISNMKDDTKVTLEGYIIKQLNDEHYLFSDRSHEIEIEIDDEDFIGIDVTSKTKVRIAGEVDKDRSSTKIEVDHIEIIK